MGAEMSGVADLVSTTEQLAEKWTGRHTVEVGTDKEYGIYMEYGTKPHTIEPDTADALRFRVDGVEVVTQHVDHPGTEPRPFMRPAAEATARSMRGAAISSDDLNELTEKLAQIVKDYAQSYAPKDTGELAASIEIWRIR